LSKKRFILFALVAAIVLSFAGSAFAATEYHWTGDSGDGKWNTQGNWLPNTGYPGIAVGDTAVIRGDAGEIIWTAGFAPAGQIVSITIEGPSGSGVTLELQGGTLFGNAIVGGSPIYGVRSIIAKSNFTITAARGYEDTKANYDDGNVAYLLMLITPSLPTKTPFLEVGSGATVKVDVPFYYTTDSTAAAPSNVFTDNWRSIVKTDTGTLEFTKGYYEWPVLLNIGTTPVTGTPNARPLDIAIEDGVVSIPSGVVDDDGHGTILGNVVFDYVTNNTGNRNPTLKVTGNEELFWPVNFTNDGTTPLIFRNYVKAHKGSKTTPNATYDIDKGASLVLGYNLASSTSNIFYGNQVQLTGPYTGDERQEVVKKGLGVLDLNYGAVGSVAVDTNYTGNFIEKFTVAEGSIEAPYGTPFNANKYTTGDQVTRLEVFNDATFATGGGEHRTWDPDDAVTSVKSFWGKLGSTLDIKTGLFAIYDNQNSTGTVHSIVSGDVIGKGGLEANDEALDNIKTVVEVHGNKNTYEGGTWIYTDAVVSFYRQNSLGTGPIVGEGGEVELASAGSNWIDLPNKIELSHQTDGLTFDVPADKLVKQTLGVAYTDSLLNKTGLGELVLAGKGVGSGRGDVNWINSARVALLASQGTVVLDHNEAAGHGGISVADGAAVRAFNGFSGDNAFYLSDANATPTVDSVIGAVLNGTTPALVTAESFNAQGDFSFQIYPKAPIKKGETLAVLKADEIDVAKASATVTDLSLTKKFTTLAVAEAEGNTLELTAAKDIDVPTITATGLAADVDGDIAIVIKVASTTPISKSVKVISDIPSQRVSDVDVEGRTFTIKGVAPSAAATYPVRVYVTTTGDWVTDTVDTDGITAYEDFVLTVGGDEGTVTPPPAVNTDSFVVTVSAKTNDAISGTVKVQEIGGTAEDVILNRPFDLKLFSVGAEEPVETLTTLDSGDTGTAEFSFAKPAAGFGYGAAYYIVASPKADDTATPALVEYRLADFSTDPASSTVGGGSSSGGCDAGFGVFALLAATGAVTLLRKKG
jgi:Synergist-CTERM protein sorting domain-containing protein